MDLDCPAFDFVEEERVLDVAYLVDAIERIAAGETVVDPALVSQLLGRVREDSPLD